LGWRVRPHRLQPGTLTKDNYGRDHHPKNYTMWLAGGGIRAGIVHGETDDFSYNITDQPVHIHDLNATILHCLGIDHERLTYRFQGRDFRLTDVHGNVVRDILV
jgi:arylsulfatase A-like enzyme